MSSSLRCAFDYVDDHPDTYPPPKQCGNCRKVAYCSKPCQRGHWDKHVFDCPGAKISTAHYLMKAIRDDLMPSDARTCSEWGFNRAGPDATMLLGLYQGLRIRIRGLRAHHLKVWKNQGILIQKIKEEFERPNSRFTQGRYYPWFLNNEWVLDESLPIPDSHSDEASIRKWDATFVAYVGHDVNEDMQNWPARRRECYPICSLALVGSYPPPNPHFNSWVSFGFCVARNEIEERSIGIRYIKLFREKKCPFLEFCDAHENAKLFALLEKYGVAPSHPHFEHVLSTAESHESVWYLKEALFSTDAMAVHSALVDYGFSNCRSEGEHATLMDIYKRMLQKPGFDEMDLHAACMQGELLKYTDGILAFSAKEKQAIAKFMKNPYPL